ncbi:FadR/GntR family transcriptional regulator [Solimonas marina]|uniref:Pyruvate dehydrogenase complex repressor n=1 Tax=Solimonas marina TaxID=2714601 RepID=A0A969WE84_9GAMM|nr:FadR/GntR family transcriptional regulator [Solimonas marina]NKF24619.1 FadR family transcriptional regulator [Solimonas marina]
MSERRSDRIAQQLEAAILEGEFSGRLPPERELAQRYGVSRQSLREGIGLLEARGLLSRRQGAGTYINDAGDQRMAEIWSEMAQRHPQLQESLIEFRVMMECRTAELAAQRHTAADRDALIRAEAAVDAAYRGGDRKAQIASDVGFHRAIADAAHNPVFSYLTGSLLKLLHDHVQLSIAGLAPQSETAAALRTQHRALLEAILSRDPAAAQACAATHMEFVRVRLNDRLAAH